MKLDRLAVVHVRKAPGCALPARRGERDAAVFAVESCLRLFWISLDEQFDAYGLAARFNGEVLRGAEAYRVLLEIGCGLQSEIVGETEIFGQLRTSWKQFQASEPAAAALLDSFMQQLIRDIKEIRTSHLQGNGGASYGSLTRILLDADIRKPTLLVGAGQTARAVLPYLSGRPLMIWNRTAERLPELMTAMGSKPVDASNIQLLSSDPAAELAAWNSAHTIIMCVPADEQRDRERLAAWHARPSREGRVLHLGLLTSAVTPWSEIAGLNTLQDLFSLRDARQESRAAFIARARNACHEKAQLQNLGGSPSMAHGWEDLSLFTLTA